MKLAIISFTGRGARLCGQLHQMLGSSGYACESFCMEKYADSYGLQPLNQSLKIWTKTMFSEMDGILFIGATGIAVRSIAPLLKNKAEDPAIVVMDEKGMFAISLLSGHLGGANELAGVLANLTGAIPVITTATDVNGRFAVDIFAKRQKLFISNLSYVKYISADILDENPVGLVSEFPIIGKVPEELQLLSGTEPFTGENGMVISLNEEKNPFLHTLHLIPRIVSIGLGCRRGTGNRMLKEAVETALREHHLSIHSVEHIASIDLKAEEPGILELCRAYEIPFLTYTAEQLDNAEGTFTPSEFVSQTTGVDNVCERSAFLASKGGRIIQKKKAGNGVAVSIAVREWSVDFE